MHQIMGAVSLWTRPPALYLCTGPHKIPFIPTPPRRAAGTTGSQRFLNSSSCEISTVFFTMAPEIQHDLHHRDIDHPARTATANRPLRHNRENDDVKSPSCSCGSTNVSSTPARENLYDSTTGTSSTVTMNWGNFYGPTAVWTMGKDLSGTTGIKTCTTSTTGTSITSFKNCNRGITMVC